MKRFVYMIMAMLLMASFVSAGSLYVNSTEPGRSGFEDGTGDYNSSAYNDSVVNIDADTLEGKTSNTFVTQDYVDQHRSYWLSDSSGLGRTDLSEYLVGTENLFEHFNSFMEYLSDVFVTDEELERANKRIDVLEARIISEDKGYDFDKTLALVRAKRTGETTTEGNYTCTPTGTCLN